MEGTDALIRARAKEVVAVFERMSADTTLARRIGDAADVVVEAIRGGGKVLLCGNGGSSADAQHLAAELVGRFMTDRQPWPAISLSDNVAAVTAISNDYSFGDVFARGVRAFGRRGDVLIGISTSGLSENVLRAFAAAKEIGVQTVALVGSGDSPLSQVADLALHVDGPNTMRVQEAQKFVGHTLFELVERALVADL